MQNANQSTQTEDYARTFQEMRTGHSERIGKWVTRIVREAELTKDIILADVGCGVGRFSKPLSQHVAKLIGIDSSHSMIEIAKHLSTQKIEWTIGRAENLPVRSFSLDAVFFSMVLEHLAKPSTAMDEAYRVLRTRGKLIIRAMLQSDLETTTWYQICPPALDRARLRNFSRKKLIALIESHGFRVSSVSSYTDFLELNTSSPLVDRIRTRTYQILREISEVELNQAIDNAIELAGSSGFLESQSSSLIIAERD